MSFTYLFFKKLIFTITPNQSEILGLSLRTTIKCCTNAGTLCHSSAKQGTNYPHAPTACTQDYTEVRCQFPLTSIGDKSDLGIGIITSLDKQGCSFLEWTVQFLLSLVERMRLVSSPRASVTAAPGDKDAHRTHSSCCTREKMTSASGQNMSWWHETAALTAFCPIIHQHLPPAELLKGCLWLFVVLQEVSSRMLLLHSRLGFLSHLASSMSS